MSPTSGWQLAGKALLVWIAMVFVVILVPDFLEDWIALPIARVVGWVVASGVWLAAIDRDWRRYFSDPLRFVLQLAFWLSAAVAGVFVSDYFRQGRGGLG